MLHHSTLQRRLNVLLSEFERARKLWNELNTEALNTANSLVNTRLEERLIDYTECWPPELNEFPNLKERCRNKMINKSAELETRLQGIFEKMTQQYQKMESHQTTLERLLLEAKNDLGDEHVQFVPVYLTCSLQKLVNHFISIFTMYKEEYIFKKKLLCEFNRIEEKQDGMVLLTVWMNQPCINMDRTKDFDELCKIEKEEWAKRFT